VSGARPIEARIEAGADARLDVPVPFRPMEIRFRSPLPPDTITTIIGLADIIRSAVEARPSAAPRPLGVGAEVPREVRGDTPLSVAASSTRPDEAVAARLAAAHVRAPAQTTARRAGHRRAFGAGPGMIPLLIVALLVLWPVWLRRRRDQR
jgi:hypothetical protein